jgi:dienelactone hydrolase
MNARRTLSVLSLTFAAGCGAEPDGAPAPETSAGEKNIASVTQESSPCAPVVATNAAHVAAGRAYAQSTAFLFFTVTSYYATGTNEPLGSSADAKNTLYEIRSGVFSTNGSGCATTGTAQPPCLAKPTQVGLFGDSYVNWPSHTFPQDLNKVAGQNFRLYAVGGFSMGSGGIGLIGPELDQALAADPDLKTVILDGGGNDILIPDGFQFPNGGSCKNDTNAPNIPDCQKIVQKALDAATTLMKRAASAGVQDVVYFFYPHVPEGTLLGGLHPNAILDYALPKVKALCEQAYSITSGQLTCHFVDMIPVFQGHPEYFALGDIHPNAQGSAAMAQAVWARMQADCIAQPASSGCCSTGQPPGSSGGCGTTRILPSPDDTSTRGAWDVGVRTVKIGRLTAEVLYPAEPGSTAGLPEATYDVRAWLPADQKTKVPDSHSPAVGPIGGHLFRDVPIDGNNGPYPVVISIHGTASFRIAAGSIATTWASRGFVVLSADYPGLMLTDQLCATAECKLTSQSCAVVGTQDIPGDVQLQMNALAAPSGPLAFLSSHLDMTRIGVTGHSQGACVAAGLSMLPGVQVVLPMAGSLQVVPSSSLKSLMFIAGINDTVIGYNAVQLGNIVCSPVAGQAPASSDTAAYQASPGPPSVTKRLVGITGGGHLVPTDLCQMNAQGKNAIQEAQADGVCGINSAVIIGLPALFDCGSIPMQTGITDVTYASTAALEETLMCRDRTSQFANLRTRLPTVGEFQEAK